MALNLVRNSRLFFTTNVNSTTGVIAGGDHTTSTTFEIQVLDGFTFSQNTNQDTVTLSEAGPAPVRGQRSFNTSLAPVEFSFSTYIRPASGSPITAEESVLWAALSSTDGSGWNAGVPSSVDFNASNAHQLQKFGLLVVVDNVTYAIDNCVLGEATIDFSIDSLATISWKGQGRALRTLGAGVSAISGTFGGAVTGSYTQKNTSALYIANKLSTATVTGNGTTYSVPITGGSITINNNVTYLTPANLGVVNVPVTYFTGTRAVSGTLNAYLRTGSTGDTGDLLADMLAASATETQPKYALEIAIGGTTNQLKVVLSAPTSILSIPTVDVQQVVSTAINFTAQGSVDGTASGDYDITGANELTVTYHAP